MSKTTAAFTLTLTAILVTSAAIAVGNYQAQRRAHCIQHVALSGVQGTADVDVAVAVCKTDYIKRFN
uniref:Uncharacterized protein n=1 Tax=Ralstonia phage BOESR1 TaxID=3034917 RepID=A0AA49EP64_9CAUD|nr:hypothetical protein HIBIKMCM_00008 [Ralstonia phage BOESR1]